MPIVGQATKATPEPGICGKHGIIHGTNGCNWKEPESGSRVLYSPPDSGNPPYRNSRVSPDADPLAPLPEPGISVYYDSETDVELLLAPDGQTLAIRVGSDRLELSGREWRGLYSGMMNLGPGRDT